MLEFAKKQWRGALQLVRGGRQGAARRISFFELMCKNSPTTASVRAATQCRTTFAIALNCVLLPHKVVCACPRHLFHCKLIEE